MSTSGRISWRPVLVSVFALALVRAAAADTRVAHEGDQWSLETPQIRVLVDARSGTLGVTDKTAGHEWKQVATAGKKAEPRFRRVRELAGPPRGIAFEAEFGWSQGKPNVLGVTLTLPEDGSDLYVAADMPQRDAAVENFAFLEPFVQLRCRGRRGGRL